MPELPPITRLVAETCVAQARHMCPDGSVEPHHQYELFRAVRTIVQAVRHSDAAQEALTDLKRVLLEDPYTAVGPIADVMMHFLICRGLGAVDAYDSVRSIVTDFEAAAERFTPEERQSQEREAEIARRLRDARGWLFLGESSRSPAVIRVCVESLRPVVALLGENDPRVQGAVAFLRANAKYAPA